MKTILKTRIWGAAGLMTIAILSLHPSTELHAANNSAPNKNHNVRILRNDDGSFTEFRKSSDERVIERRNYSDRTGGSGDRVLRMSIIYRKDIYGKLRSGKIHDGSGVVLYRVVYGYHRITGQLVAENMFDARVKRTKVVTDATTGTEKEVEIPVRRVFHHYDAQGRPNKPVVISTQPGKLADELFKQDNGSSYPRSYIDQSR